MYGAQNTCKMLLHHDDALTSSMWISPGNRERYYTLQPCLWFGALGDHPVGTVVSRISGKGGVPDFKWMQAPEMKSLLMVCQIYGFKVS